MFMHKLVSLHVFQFEVVPCILHIYIKETRMNVDLKLVTWEAAVLTSQFTLPARLPAQGRGFFCFFWKSVSKILGRW